MTGEEKHLEKARNNNFFAHPKSLPRFSKRSQTLVSKSTIGELALHYLNQFDIAVLRVLSKFELRRLCRVVNAVPLARMGAPTPEEAGFIDVFETIEVGRDRVTVLR